MHDAIVDNDVPTKGITNALMPEANPQQRHLLPKPADNVIGQPGFARRTWAGRDQNALGIQFANLVEGNLVIAADLQRHLHLAQILDEVVGERIVIIYDQNHAADYPRFGSLATLSQNLANPVRADFMPRLDLTDAPRQNKSYLAVADFFVQPHGVEQ